jgi:DHA2 family multidrug resistance protein
VLCGIAQSVEEIVVYRVVQGMFGAALVPLSQTVMLDIYPPERRAWAMSLWGLGVMIGPIMGPILGGWLTEYYSWRWIFFINVPFGIATVLGLMAFMDESGGNAGLPFDWLGFAALSVAIGALQLMLDRGEQLGWFDSREIVTMAIVSAAGFYFFLAHTLTAPRPFISVGIFRDRNFVVGLGFMFVCGMLLIATMAVMAPFLQGVAGFPIIDVGLLLGTRGIGMAIGMLGAGRLIAGIDPRLLLGFGLGCCVVSLYYTIGFAPETAVFTIVWTSILQGIGLGTMFVPLNTLALGSLPPALRTEGTAMWTLIRNLGGSIGVSIVIADLSNKTTLMHARLAESVTPFNQALADPAAAMLDPRTDTGRALLEQLVSQQAAIIAYSNNFKLMMVMTLLAFPLIALVRVEKGLRPAAASAAAD